MSSGNRKKRSTNIPTRKEIIQAAADLVPVLRERAEKAEDFRKMPDETIKAVSYTHLTLPTKA